MTPQLEEALRLLRLAQRDCEVLEILAETGDKTHAAAGFHAQQAVEKALKALLCAHDVDFPRTHDLEGLLKRLAGTGDTPPTPVQKLRALTPYAVDFRYDDEPVRLLATGEMRAIVDEVIGFVADRLELRQENDS
ncbi:MAG: HEPN domain-containing protein [Sulfurisoma sp.]|nr:HEPN domain-containing protein [Sulfurisoma sp.]